MSLTGRIVQVITAIGVDIKGLMVRLVEVENGPHSPLAMINTAARLIQTQRIVAQLVLRGQVK